MRVKKAAFSSPLWAFRAWFENYWQYCLLGCWNLEAPHPHFQSQHPFHQLCDLGKVASPLWALLCKSQAGEVLGNWEAHVKGSGACGERATASGTTHPEKGLRKGSRQ